MNPNSRCPVETTLAVIGGKWKAVILYHLSEGTLRFGDLRRRMPLITQKMLTQQLRELEADGIIHRQAFAEVPPRVEYSLTELGESLEGVLTAMCLWGEHFEHLRNQQEAG